MGRECGGRSDGASLRKCGWLSASVLWFALISLFRL